jgi:hypothetical protein
MSTEGETLQVSVVDTLQVLDMSTLGDAADVNPVIKFLPHILQHLVVESSDCLHDSFVFSCGKLRDIGSSDRGGQGRRGESL